VHGRGNLDGYGTGLQFFFEHLLGSAPGILPQGRIIGGEGGRLGGQPAQAVVAFGGYSHSKTLLKAIITKFWAFITVSLHVFVSLSLRAKRSNPWDRRRKVVRLLRRYAPRNDIAIRSELPACPEDQYKCHDDQRRAKPYDEPYP